MNIKNLKKTLLPKHFKNRQSSNFARNQPIPWKFYLYYFEIDSNALKFNMRLVLILQIENIF